MPEPGSNSNLKNVIGNIVDIQQSVITQFEQLTRGLENLRIEIHTSVNSLREDIRRVDDRAQKQVDELNLAHARESSRLIDIINVLLKNEKESNPTAPRPAPVQNGAGMQQHMQQQLQQQMQQAAYLPQNLAALYQHQNDIMQLQRLFASSSLGMGQAAFPGMAVGAQGAVGAPAKLVEQAPQVMRTAVPVATGVVPQPQKQQLPATVQEVKKEAPLTPTKAPVPNAAPLVSVPLSATVPPVAPAVLPATIPTFAPSVDVKPLTPKAPFSFGSGSAGIFGGTPTFSAKIPGLPTTLGEKKDEEDVVEEFEPEVNFEPVIPLPELVEVHTGEENEEEVFNERCKLYRYADETKEWKERGTGNLRVLKNKETKKCRVVMRREHILKVCANFALARGMTIQFMAKSDKALTWFCEDHSDDAPTHIKLSAKFGHPETAESFKKIFEKSVAEHDNIATPTKASVVKKEVSDINPVTKELSEKKPIVDKKDVADSKTLTAGFGEKFKPKPGSWECKNCYVSNASTDEACVCCGSSNNGTAEKKSELFPKSAVLPQASTKFSFGLAAAAAAAKDTTQTKSPAFGAGSGSNTGTSIFGGGVKGDANVTTTPGNKPSFSFKPSSLSAATVSTPSFGFGKSTGSAAATTTTKPSFSFVTGTSDAGSSTTTTQSPVTFSFKPSVQGGNTSLFGSSKLTEEIENASTPKDGEPSEPLKVFGNMSTKESFASLVAKSEKNIFEGETAKKAQEEFKAQQNKANNLSSIFQRNDKKDEDTENDETVDTTNNEDYEPDVDFKPVVPLPDIVAVVTGEEDDTVLFKSRARLYKYSQDTKENKERGVGELKILHNKNTGCYRVVMRREQVHKICANFRITEKIELNPKKGSNNVFMWICVDFSEDTENGIKEIFTVRFKDENVAKEFQKTFEEAQANLKK